MFPIPNTRGKNHALAGRTSGDDKAKYINSPEVDVFHKSVKYNGLHEARQKPEAAATSCWLLKAYMERHRPSPDWH